VSPLSDAQVRADKPATHGGQFTAWDPSPFARNLPLPDLSHLADEASNVGVHRDDVLR
jgi:hypothetical protein